MRRSNARVVLVASVLALGCGSGDTDIEGRPAETVAPLPPPPPAERPTTSPYDDEGNLRASDQRVAGLTLPVALTVVADEDRHHAYTTDVPIGRVLRYFGPRLTTGEVEERPGGGAIYRHAVAREATGGTVRMDVSILPIPDSLVQIDIREEVPPPASVPSETEALQALEERAMTAE